MCVCVCSHFEGNKSTINGRVGSSHSYDIMYLVRILMECNFCHFVRINESTIHAFTRLVFDFTSDNNVPYIVIAVFNFNRVALSLPANPL